MLTGHPTTVDIPQLNDSSRDLMAGTEKNGKGGDDDLKATLRKFGENTSIKGIPRVFKAGHVSVRLLWAVAVVGGIGFGTFLIVQLITQFLEYDVHTTYKECLTCAPKFPDVTVCNLNPSYQLEDKPMNYIFDTVQYVNSIISQEQLNELMGFEMSEADRDEFLGEFISLAGYYQNTLLENITAVLEIDIWRQLVVDCSWHGWNWNKHPKHDCMRTSLYRVLSPEYQWCITFHTNRSGEVAQNDIRGLTAIFYLDDFSDAHIPKFLSDLRHAQAKGMRVVIHEPGSLPDLKLGFNIPPGHDSIVTLTGIERTRLPHPYSNCTYRQDLEEEGTGEGVEGAVRYRYSYDGCVNLCQQRAVMERCGCLSAHIALSPALLQSGKPFCALVEGEDDLGAVFARTMKAAHCAMTINTSAIPCDCQVPCHDLQYQHTLLATKWPHPNYQMAFYEQYILKQPYREKFDYYQALLSPNISSEQRKIGLQASDLMSRNFLQLNIHFPRASTWQHDDKPQITSDSLLGVTGGLLNLWMGVTFITIVELLELCLNIVQNAMVRRASGGGGSTTRVMSLSEQKHEAWNNRMPPVQS